MNKSVLISIRPQWCELIASGKKTVDIRKNAPKLPTPFKCYIYETLDTRYKDIGVYCPDARLYKNFLHHPGRVIGELVCEKIKPVDVPYPAYMHEVNCEILDASCLSYWYLHQYGGSGKRLYGWHISDLVIYDAPKEITEFQRLQCERVSDCGTCSKFDRENFVCMRPLIVTRPPQSWCYVETLGGDA